MDYNTTLVQTSSPGFIRITGNVPEAYKSFLEYYVIPAGINITYVSV
jgi:ribosomal protein L30E